MAIISNKKLRIFKVLNILNWIFVLILIGAILNAIAIIVGLYQSYYNLFFLVGVFLFLGFLGLYQLIIMIVYGFNLRLLDQKTSNWYSVYWLMVFFLFIFMIKYHFDNSNIAFVIVLTLTIVSIILCLYISRAMSKVNEFEGSFK